MLLQKIWRRGLHLIAGVAGLAVAAIMFTAPVSAETISVGVIQPQAGDCAQWGVPITRGTEIWAQQLNDEGGILSGDGKRYQIEIKPYDNICYIPGEELKAGRRMILDDGVRFALNTFTPGSRQAIAELTDEHHVLVTTYGAGYLSASHPYLLGGITGSPHAYMLIVSRILAGNPDAKRVAIITADSSYGAAAQAYYKAGVMAHADSGAEIVYDESYAPDATKDMLGLLTPLMASKPDIICELGFVPAQQAIMIETVTQLGFDGIFCAEGFVLPLIHPRVGPEQLGNRMFSAYSFEASEPTFSARGHEFYKIYVEKYGVEEWSPFAPIGYAALGTIEAAIKMSPSIDSKVVMETLYAAETVDHPIFGPSGWGGNDIFGTDHHLLTPLPIYGVDDAGNLYVDAVVDAHKWWVENKAIALPILEAGGQIYKD